GVARRERGEGRDDRRASRGVKGHTGRHRDRRPDRSDPRRAGLRELVGRSGRGSVGGGDRPGGAGGVRARKARRTEVPLRLATAPVTWGVWEQTTARDDLVPPELLLETMRGLGYTATELGPPGYFTPQLLEQHEMELVGGFAPLRYEDEAG